MTNLPPSPANIFVPQQLDSFNLPEVVNYTDRQKLVFAPYSPKGSLNEEQNYDYLFDDTADIDDRTIEGAAIRNPEGRGATSDISEEYSMGILKRFDNEEGLDPNIKAIISKYSGAVSLANEETMQSVRNNPELRLELGVYFLGKLETLEEILPQRVAKNHQKNGNASGYENIPGLKSREYASLLALAHLDGTFDPLKSKSDSITTNEAGQTITGQHRVASEMLLFW